MKLRKLLSQLPVWLPGAINGLLVGLLTEEIRFIYVANQLSRAMHEGGAPPNYAADFFYPTRQSLVLLVCVVAFAGVSHLVHRYFLYRPQRLLLICSILTAFALSAGYFMEPRKPGRIALISVVVFIVVSALALKFWINHPASALARWLVIGISVVIVVGASTQFVGLFMVQRHELRNPLVWLLWLSIVMVINAIYGAVLQRAFPRTLSHRTHVRE